jgi:hypothetical protein
VDTGSIPIFVVFTHYDDIINKHHKLWRQKNSGTTNLSESQSFAIAEEPAFTEYREKYEAGLLAMIKGRSNVKICRLAIVDGHEYQLKKYPHIAPNGKFSHIIQILLH